MMKTVSETSGLTLLVSAFLIGTCFASQGQSAGNYLEDRTSSEAVRDSNLPEFYLIGDSIRQGYGDNVATSLLGKATVKWPPGNCMNSQNILINLGYWRKFASSPQVVLFNCGHWDASDWDHDGDSLTTLDEYGRNIRLIIRRLRRYYPDAKIVFATTTPMNSKFCGMKTLAYRSTDDIRRYNEVAVAVAKKEGVRVCDLFALTKDWPAEDFVDYCHFKPTANERLAGFITDFLCRLTEDRTDVPESNQSKE